MWLPTSLLVLHALRATADSSSASERYNTFADGTTDRLAFPGGSDLTHFVTRPDLESPRYIVTKHKPEAITPGYWFLGPYTGLGGATHGGKEHVGCQIGPQIFDGDGVLVWSSACIYSDRNAWGFQPVTINGTQFLSFHQQGIDLEWDDIGKEDAAVILNDHYQEVQRITDSTVSRGEINFHEFNMLEDGKYFIVSVETKEEYYIDEESEKAGTSSKMLNPGFLVVETATNKTIFDWKAIDHGISIDESYAYRGESNAALVWDPFHINSIDRDDYGNYYVSLRHASTIYKIDGKDGHIIWRLGGKNSDFKIGEGVQFQWQHHIRLRFANETHTVVSFLDNGSEDENRSLGALKPHIPAAKVIICDTTKMTAEILRKGPRPDKGVSNQLGSVQLIDIDRHDFDSLTKTNIFVGWGRHGYITEFDANNEPVMEAVFMSNREKSYRAFKYPFVGKPLTKPDVKLIPVAYGSGELASAFYVSWNGATEVKSWVFYGSEKMRGSFQNLGSVEKNGFESSWIGLGRIAFGYVEALDSHGKSLGKSLIVPLKYEENVNNAIPLDAPFPGTEATKADQEDSTADDFVIIDDAPEDSTTSIFLDIIYIMIYCFAAYGLFYAGKDSYKRFVKRRKANKSWFSSESGNTDHAYASLGQSEETLTVEEHEIGMKRQEEGEPHGAVEEYHQIDLKS